MTDHPDVTTRERIEVLAQRDGVRIERIVSHGHASPPGFWYDQHEHEWVTIISGAATLEFRNPNEHVDLQPGDHVLITAHRPHRVTWTAADGATVWLAVFFGPAVADGGPSPDAVALRQKDQ
jgi:cupin 2 domain-containing protein